MKSPNGFDIGFVFLASVPPYDASSPVTIETDVLKTENKTTDYLFKIFDSAIDEAKIEIHFNSDGKQNNDIRDSILEVSNQGNTNQKKIAQSKILAEKLYKQTDERNGTGLLTIIVGKKGRTTRTVIIRFKGDEGLYRHGKRLLVDYLSEVFTKKSNHYKLAVYEDIFSTKAFWKGYSIDKQISSNSYKPFSYFWIESFLNSKTSLTPAQGTWQFSKVLKSILTTATNVEEQEEIISGIINLKTKRNIQMSVGDFCRLYLSDKLSKKVREETSEDFYNSVFTIDPETYSKEFGKTVLSLQDGITAFVPTFNYDKHVTEKQNNDGSKNIVIEGKLKGKKINVQKKEKK